MRGAAQVGRHGLHVDELAEPRAQAAERRPRPADDGREAAAHLQELERDGDVGGERAGARVRPRLQRVLAEARVVRGALLEAREAGGGDDDVDVVRRAPAAERQQGCAARQEEFVGAAEEFDAGIVRFEQRFFISRVDSCKEILCQRDAVMQRIMWVSYQPLIYSFSASPKCRR